MDWKRLAKKLFFLPAWITVLFTAVSAAALVMVFVKGLDASPVGYVSYVFAFYTLCVLCVFCWKTLPGYWKAGKEKLYASKTAGRYLTDAAYRTHVSLWCSFAIDLVYAGVNAVSAVCFRTHWFALFAVYYTILAFMRFLLVRYIGKNRIGSSRFGELHRARLCACILLTVNLALTGTVLMMVYLHRGFDYPGILIYVMALYTFYITTTAVIGMVRGKKYGSPVMSMAKIIKTAAALVSMLSLETAMFSQFGGDMAAGEQELMIMLTGAGIAVIVSAMAIVMIVCTTKEIRSLK
ncbi:MAG: hypothetical protein IJD13_08990 [Oscillospiraceae bacterium]|nr:hypothetical protein [Oscillospiraceae bacterium]